MKSKTISLRNLLFSLIIIGTVASCTMEKKLSSNKKVFGSNPRPCYVDVSEYADSLKISGNGNELGLYYESTTGDLIPDRIRATFNGKTKTYNLHDKEGKQLFKALDGAVINISPPDIDKFLKYTEKYAKKQLFLAKKKT